MRRDRVAVITGAGSGIGRALSVELARLGHRVAIADIQYECLEETLTQMAGPRDRHLLMKVDVAKGTDVEAFAQAVQAKYGAIHLLVNNAGVTAFGTFESMSDATFERIMAVNFYGVVRGCRSFIPLLKGSPDPCIVNMASVFGLFGFPSQSAYCASKFAIRGFSETLHTELAGEGIHVMTVLPGGTRTNIAESAEIGDIRILGDKGKKALGEFKTKSYSTPEMVAKKMIKGVQSKKFRLTTGMDAKAVDSLVRLAAGWYPAILRFLFISFPFQKPVWKVETGLEENMHGNIRVEKGGNHEPNGRKS